MPFRTVYIHGLVRDERGQKMSKSKGNVIDPLELVDRFGTDALRFAIAALCGPGRDVKLGASRVETARSFVTKLWNAARFCEMNKVAPVPGFDPAAVRSPLCRWALDAANAAVRDATAALEAFRLDEYASVGHAFAWHTVCDWLLELAKPVFYGTDEAAKAELRGTVAHVLGVLLRLLHPVMPFVTEELWGAMGFGAEGSLVRTAWPEPVAVTDAEAARAELGWVVRLIGLGAHGARRGERGAVRADAGAAARRRSPRASRGRSGGASRSVAWRAPTGWRRWRVPSPPAPRRRCWTRRRWCCRSPG